MNFSDYYFALIKRAPKHISMLILVKNGQFSAVLSVLLDNFIK